LDGEKIAETKGKRMYAKLKTKEHKGQPRATTGEQEG